MDLLKSIIYEYISKVLDAGYFCRRVVSLNLPPEQPGINYNDIGSGGDILCAPVRSVSII